MSTLSFSVKVGNINEVQTYPLFNHFLLDDLKINGMDRSKEEGFTKDKAGVVESVDKGKYSSTKSGDSRYMYLNQEAQNTFFQDDHISGYPYNEKTNKSTLFIGKTADEEWEVNPMEPGTWVGNAITFGKSFAVNFVTQKVDKAKMMKIPGLGFSFNEAIASIESKDFISVLGLIRKAISESVKGTLPASSALERKIDTSFKEFLTGITLSEATDGDELELIKVANQILNNRGSWERVKDLSYATNLVGPDEKNIPVKIKGSEQYKQIIDKEKKSKATENSNILSPIIYEGTPSKK
jgi:hypothetical protein